MHAEPEPGSNPEFEDPPIFILNLGMCWLFPKHCFLNNKKRQTIQTAMAKKGCCEGQDCHIFLVKFYIRRVYSLIFTKILSWIESTLT